MAPKRRVARRSARKGRKAARKSTKKRAAKKGRKVARKATKKKSWKNVISLVLFWFDYHQGVI